MIERTEVSPNIEVHWDQIAAYKCEECGALAEDTAGPIYECGECGERYNRDNSADGTSHRCPACGKFGARVADWSCQECGQGEVEEADAYSCSVCGEIVEGDDMEEHARDHEPSPGEETQA